MTAVAARRERASTFWVGDVWKVLDVLLEYRKDLRIHVVPTPPSGLVLVRGLDPRSTVLRARLDEIVARYRGLEVPVSPEDWPSRYPLVENSGEAALRRLLAT